MIFVLQKVINETLIYLYKALVSQTFKRINFRLTGIIKCEKTFKYFSVSKPIEPSAIKITAIRIST